VNVKRLMMVCARRSLRDALVATLLAPAVSALAACGNDRTGDHGGQTTIAVTSQPTSDPRDVFGVVLAGPTCPVETADEPCPPRPVDATIDAQDAKGDVLASTRTDTAGHYSLALASGSYTIVASTGAGLPMCQPVTITVTSGPPIRTDISCDTGIR
jgi:hypothetical protein